MKIISPLLLLLLMNSLSAAEWPITLYWAETITLSTPLTGKIDSVRVELGTQVKKGQLLATLDARIYQAEVKRAKSTLTRNKLTYEEAQRAFERAKELYDRTVLSTTDFQQVELEHAVARSNYHISQASLAKAKINLEYTQIHAPIDGMITERLIHTGEIVNSRFQVQPLLRMAATSQMIARAWLPAKDLENLAIDQQVNLNIQDQTIPSTIKTIGVMKQETTQGSEYAVDLAFTPTKNILFLPGLRGHVTLP